MCCRSYSQLANLVAADLSEGLHQAAGMMATLMVAHDDAHYSYLAEQREREAIAAHNQASGSAEAAVKREAPEGMDLGVETDENPVVL